MLYIVLSVRVLVAIHPLLLCLFFSASVCLLPICLSQGETGPKGEPGMAGTRGPTGHPGKRGKQVGVCGRLWVFVSMLM